MEYSADRNGCEIALLLYASGLTSPAAIVRYILGKPDRQRDFRLFEYAVARKYSALRWNELPRAFLEPRGLLKMDMGVDCLTADASHAIQAKWQEPGSRVERPKITSFYTQAAGCIRAKRLTIVTSEAVKLSSHCPDDIEHHFLPHAELARILVDVCKRYMPHLGLCAAQSPPRAVTLQARSPRAVTLQAPPRAAAPAACSECASRLRVVMKFASGVAIGMSGLAVVAAGVNYTTTDMVVIPIVTIVVMKLAGTIRRATRRR